MNAAISIGLGLIIAASWTPDRAVARVLAVRVLTQGVVSTVLSSLSSPLSDLGFSEGGGWGVVT